VKPVPVATKQPLYADGQGWMLALKGDWYPCHIRRSRGKPLYSPDAAQSLASGMSGSPILDVDGNAVGVVSIGNKTSGPHPDLAGSLPAWLARALDHRVRRRRKP
jgi:hypothetical protein